MATKTDRPKVLIEQWLPIAEIGAECTRDASAAKKPPLNRLHVWWARRPLTVCRAAILASLLPAYPMDGDEDIRPWPQKFHKRFPTFDTYVAWFLRLLGIFGRPNTSRRILEWAKTRGIKLTPSIIRRLPSDWTEGLPRDIGVSIPYGYPRAFSYNPSEEQLDTLYDLVHWTWGTREITFSDPMAGGGSIPFEALRYGLTVHANELNPVASVILKATLEYPAKFGLSLAGDIRKYAEVWCEKVRERLEPFYPLSQPDESIHAYVWARTVSCPVTGKPVPLAPNWWLMRGSDPVALQLIADAKADRCHFEIAYGRKACAKIKADLGTIKRGTGISPWTGESIDGDFIKAEAQAGRMGEQICAVSIKKPGEVSFRPPTAEEKNAYERAVLELRKRRPAWEASGLIPNEPRREGRADWACEIYGATHWRDTYTPRQLLAMTTFVECYHEAVKGAVADLGQDRATAVRVYLGIAIDIAADYNSRQTVWNPGRGGVSHAFGRHDLSMRWSFAEFDASRNLAPWVTYQVVDAFQKLARLTPPSSAGLFSTEQLSPVERLHISVGPAQSLAEIHDGELSCITVDPPYYDNVMYAECSNYFYVWMKRSLGDAFPNYFASDLAPDDDEAVMNTARFKHMGRRKTELAISDYENKMMAAFKEMHRVLSADGVLTVMFTHKQVDAWDTLGSALTNAGLRIDASWPVHTEMAPV
jgi:putative DNA methylase